MRIGDSIVLPLGQYGERTFTAQDIKNNRVLVYSDTPISEGVWNNKTKESEFSESDLCRWLNGAFYDSLPRDTQSKIVKLRNAPFIRIPSREEVFGTSGYYDCEFRSDRLSLQSMTENRMFAGGSTDCFWMEGQLKSSPEYHPICLANGRTLNKKETEEAGVRLALWICA